VGNASGGHVYPNRSLRVTLARRDSDIMAPACCFSGAGTRRSRAGPTTRQGVSGSPGAPRGRAQGAAAVPPGPDCPHRIRLGKRRGRDLGRYATPGKEGSTIRVRQRPSPAPAPEDGRVSVLDEVVPLESLEPVVRRSANSHCDDSNSGGLAIHSRLSRGGPSVAGPRSVGDVSTLPLGPLERLQPGPAAMGMSRRCTAYQTKRSFSSSVLSHRALCNRKRARQAKRLPQ
jgi:hypothetical protein